MYSQTAILRMEDLEKWSTPDLKKRRRDKRRMMLALSRVGYRGGFHFSLLHHDEEEVRAVLARRRRG